MEQNGAPAAALAALEEVIPPHLRANRHGANFMGERYEIIRAALAAPAPSAPADQPSPDKQGQQGEWKWVPVEPTERMLEAWTGGLTNMGYEDKFHVIRRAKHRYAAMLAASPAPTEEPRTDGGEVCRG